MVKEVQLAIAFADVSQSTKLYERLGDEKARSAIADCVRVMSDATVKYGGTVIKTIGDEVMSTFPSADAAADAVAFMQEEITEGMSVDGIPLAIRAGFHYGSALLENNDVFGDAVNTAARMAGQAKSGQIMTTGATVDRLSENWQASTRQIDSSVVKGKRDPISMFEVIWQREDVTRMVTAVFGQSANAGRMVLTVGALQASTLWVVAGIPGANILNNNGLDSMLIADTMVLVAGGQVGADAGQEVNIQALTAGEPLAQVQLTQSGSQAFINNIAGSTQVISRPAATVSNFLATALNLAFEDNVAITTLVATFAARETAGESEEVGVIDPSLFEDISLYAFEQQGIKLPADQREEEECDPDVEDCDVMFGLEALESEPIAFLDEAA